LARVASLTDRDGIQAAESERRQKGRTAGMGGQARLPDAGRRHPGSAHRSVFQDFLAKKFSETRARPTALHKALAAMPFAAFVTTNFDRLFENALSDVHQNSVEVLTHLDRVALRNPLGRDFPFLLKTHGCASKPDSLVLGLKEFRDSIHDNRPIQMLLQTIFLRYQVFFIGHSLTDPDLLFMLDQLVATYGVPPGRHLAFIKDADVGPLRGRTFRDNYGIEVLRYTATAGHPEVLAFVQDLQKQVQERRAELNREVRRKLLEEFQTEANALLASPAKAVNEAAGLSRPAGRYSSPTLADYCRQHLEPSVWTQLTLWYESLHGSTAHELRCAIERLRRSMLHSDCWRLERNGSHYVPWVEVSTIGAAVTLKARLEKRIEFITRNGVRPKGVGFEPSKD